jgi:hypothetical protein
MRFDKFSFGSIRIDGVTRDYDVVIDRGEIRKRKKKTSKQFRDEFGHTPLSIEEDLPWKCSRLVVGTGAYGRLPVMKEVKREAERRKVELLVLPTTRAIEVLRQDTDNTNAILHVTCQGQVNGQIQAAYAERERYEELTDAKYIDPGAIFDIMAITVIRHNLQVATAARA